MDTTTPSFTMTDYTVPENDTTLVEHANFSVTTNWMLPTNGTFDPCEITLDAIKIFLLIIYSVLFFVAVGGNVLVCLVVLGQRRMRTATNFFLLNLAIGDIAKGIFCIPFTFVVNVMVPYWPFGSFMCPFVMYMQAVVVFLSAFTLVAMSFDRYIAVIYPLRQKLTVKQVGVILMVVWALAIAVPIPTAVTSVMASAYNSSEECHRDLCFEQWDNEYHNHIYTMMIMCLQYFVPLVVLMFTYSKIGYVIWIKRTPGEAEQRRDERIASSKRKMVKMMIVVVIIYALCWLPIHALRLVEERDKEIYDFKYFQVIWTTAHWLAMSYACYNPIVYFWMNRRFRVGFKGLLFICKAGKVNLDMGTGHLRQTRIPLRNNSRSSSRYSPTRVSVDESCTKAVKFSYLQRGEGV